MLESKYRGIQNKHHLNCIPVEGFQTWSFQWTKRGTYSRLS